MSRDDSALLDAARVRALLTDLLRGELGMGYTHEDQLVGENRSYASARAGLGYKWQFSKTAAFTNELAYNYDLSDSSNWIVLEKAAVTAALTATFSLKASYTLLYNNEPVPTFSFLRRYEPAGSTDATRERARDHQL